jgi:hypothetical protein
MRYITFACLFILAVFFTACDAKKANLAGRWVTKETIVEKGFPADKTFQIVRSLSLNANGQGEFSIVANGEVTRRDAGNWSVTSDVFLLDHEGGKTVYFRILRLSNETLVIRTEEGVERVYNRVQ